MIKVNSRNQGSYNRLQVICITTLRVLTILFIMFMFSKLLAAALLIVPFFESALATPAPALTTCAVCAPTIFFSGQTRKLTLAREEGSNTLQCK